LDFIEKNKCFKETFNCYVGNCKHVAEADLRYVEHLCRRAKIALGLVLLRRELLFCSPTQLLDL